MYLKEGWVTWVHPHIILIPERNDRTAEICLIQEFRVQCVLDLVIVAFINFNLCSMLDATQGNLYESWEV